MDFELQAEHRIDEGKEIFYFICKDPNRLNLNIYVPFSVPGLTMTVISTRAIFGYFHNSSDACQAIDIFGNYYFMKATWKGACTTVDNSAVRDAGKGFLNPKESIVRYQAINFDYFEKDEDKKNKDEKDEDEALMHDFKGTYFEKKVEWATKVNSSKKNKNKTDDDSLFPMSAIVGICVGGYLISIAIAAALTWILCSRFGENNEKNHSEIIHRNSVKTEEENESSLDLIREQPMIEENERYLSQDQQNEQLSTEGYSDRTTIP
jgi:hypothetical protein